jgi:hypothetical protein
VVLEDTGGASQKFFPASCEGALIAKASRIAMMDEGREYTKFTALWFFKCHHLSSA